MFLNVLPLPTAKLLEQMKSSVWLKSFYLAGGTALALQYGHRQSVDLDWFTKDNFSTKSLLVKLKKHGKFNLLNEEENTVEGYLDEVKLSFMTYPYKLIQKKIKFSDNIYLAGFQDIALMKVSAISQRNTKKDFIDLYWYLHREKTDLVSLFGKMKIKFSGIDYDMMHICKSLVYFKEADKEVMPMMLEPVSWEKVKKFFIDEVKKLVM